MKLISCDWGTSRFRVYLMDRKTLTVEASLSSEGGIASVNSAWQKQTKVNRIDFFKQYLLGQIQKLADNSRTNLTGLPILISGMASSSIGMLELPYAQLPFSISGEDMVSHKLSASEVCPHEIYLFSGLASSSDVMRGEETQVVGLQNTIRAKKALVILPGTHSKHIRVGEGKVEDFSTYMTGELFATTSHSTILTHSVTATEIDKKTLFDEFTGGVECVDAKGYLSALFKVRTRTLLQNKTDTQNFAFLSGIHIGEELRHIKNLDPDTEIIICASPNMAFLYRLALQALGIQLNNYVVPGELAKLATAYGHMALADELKID